MDQQIFESQPLKKPTLGRVLAFGAVLFIGLASVVAAVVVPGMRSTDDRSKAANLVSCAGSIAAPAAVCGEKCMSTDDCGSGLRCMAWGVTSGMTCRNAINPGSVTCSGATNVPTTAPTKPPASTLPSAPPGCVYTQVQCIQAPCDPVLKCTSPTPVATKPSATTVPSAPPGCVYKQVQCIQAPCDPILVCSSPTPTPTPPTGCVYKQVECIQAPCTPILVCDGPVVSHTIKLVKDGTNGWMDVDAINEAGVLTQQFSSRFRYTGTWATDTSTVYNGGSSTWTPTPGATVTFTTSASSLKLMTTRAFNRASFDVYVDGVKKGTVSTINATRQDQYVVDLTPYL